MPFNLGGPELIIILVIILIVFGAGRLPNVMRDVGKGVKEFKRAQTGEEAEAPISSASTTTGPAPVPPSGPVASSNGAAAQTTTTAPPRSPETTSRA